MRISEESCRRSAPRGRWGKNEEETVCEGHGIDETGRRICDAAPFFRGLGGYERVTPLEVASISPSRLEKPYGATANERRPARGRPRGHPPQRAERPRDRPVCR